MTHIGCCVPRTSMHCHWLDWKTMSKHQVPKMTHSCVGMLSKNGLHSCYTCEVWLPTTSSLHSLILRREVVYMLKPNEGQNVQFCINEICTTQQCSIKVKKPMSEFFCVSITSYVSMTVEYARIVIAKAKYGQWKHVLFAGSPVYRKKRISRWFRLGI